MATSALTVDWWCRDALRSLRGDSTHRVHLVPDVGTTHRVLLVGDAVMFPRFTVTPAFDAFLETIVVEENGLRGTYLVCTECSDTICEVEQDDTLAVLVRTVMAHDLDCEARTTEQLSNHPTATPIQQEES